MNQATTNDRLIIHGTASLDETVIDGFPVGKDVFGGVPTSPKHNTTNAPIFQAGSSDDVLGFTWISVLGREMKGRNACFREYFLRDFRSTQPTHWLQAKQQGEGNMLAIFLTGCFQ